eukprot:1155433-Pelagomonas_calceolata.AAC.1
MHVGMGRLREERSSKPKFVLYVKQPEGLAGQSVAVNAVKEQRSCASINPCSEVHRHHAQPTTAHTEHRSSPALQ